MTDRMRERGGPIDAANGDRPIDRRDFLQGAAIATLATGLAPELALAAEAERAAQDAPGYYPPLLEGMRGSHPGSFEDAHALRDGAGMAAAAADTGEDYDLIVVGAGISGLAAAHFYRAAAGDGTRILILDNHDDFGGHAKRNEARIGGHLRLMNGGTASIESPTPFSPVADGLMRTLGIFPEKLAQTAERPDHYRTMGLGQATFFDRETFGSDRLVRSPPRRGGTGDEARRTVAAFLAQTPLSEAARRDVLMIETGNVDPLPGLTSDQKKDRLSRISYRDFLVDLLKADPAVIPYYLHRTDGLWGCGIDAISALDCWGSGQPGFQGLKLAPGATPRMGYTPRGYTATGGSYEYHFPDGNASIARLLVRDLIPAAMPGSTVEDVVTARADYARLDRAGAPVRLRLSSIAVRAANVGAGGGVELLYRRSGKTFRVRGRHCVMASWNMMIPYICPELPAPQKEALAYLVKTPLVYTSVALTNWRAFQRLGVSNVSCPGGYHSSFSLDRPQHIGAYRSYGSPDEPIMVHMTRAPAQPGLSERDQHRAGRIELLTTPFETFERAIRDQLGRALAGGGFDPARDIAGITVNRWPHGYAPEYNALVDGDAGLPLERARARCGAIAIANADSGGGAYTDVAIDQAHRAVRDLIG